MIEKENLVYYFQRKNDLFGDNTLSICYKASDEEVRANHLTDRNVLIFIKCKEFNDLNEHPFNVYEVIKEAFKNKEIFLRVQSECILGMYGDSHCDCESQRQQSIKMIRENDGIFVHLGQEALGFGIEYKLKELELQVNGRLQDGSFIGERDKEEAQKYIMNTTEYVDARKYNVVYNVLKLIGLSGNKFILITDSEKKLNDLECLGLRVEKYSEYIQTQITVDNVAEYLSKILENKYDYSNDVLEKIFNILENENCNDRTIGILTKIVNRIKRDNSYILKENIKEKFLETYNNMLCGKEKKYIYSDTGIAKVQNKFSCKVNAKIFATLKRTFNKNIFDRVSAEQLYYFRNKTDGLILKIRNSEVLEVKNNKSCFLKGQMYSQQTIFSEKNERIIENEITVSKLKAYFENNNYEYVKKIEAITFISEGQLENVNVYIKRLPSVENRIMDIYGKREDIKKFLDLMTDNNKDALSNIISDFKIDDEDYAEYNLVFTDYNSTKEEEVRIFNIMNGD